MFFDAKFLTILAFAIVTIIVIFCTKDKVNVVAGVIFSYFIFLLLLNLVISNYEVIKEATIITTFYFACILTITISNFSLNNFRINLKQIPILLVFLVPLIMTTFLMFFISKNVEKINQIFDQNKFEQQKSVIFGSSNLGNKSSLEIINENNKFTNLAQKKSYADNSRMSYFKERLSKNSLLQNFSIVILIISGSLVTSAIFFHRKEI
ncbi:MAG: hypothetical protein FJ368_01895 [Pelagibacterales bacterium]|nr:hypothetical protein [Pelagibacterales bacterium]